MKYINMGKVFSVLTMLIGLGISGVYAQDYYGSTYSSKKVNLGITLAPSMSWLRYGNQEDRENQAKMGYAYGLLADFGLSENYYFSTGFLVNTLKAQTKADMAPNSLTYQLQYVEIPFGLKLQSTQRYYRSYYGQFGFSAGFKINAQQYEPESEKVSLGNNANALRLGLQIGGGINWQLDHKLTMMTGLSLNNGFTQVMKEGKPKNSYVAFNFAIFF